MHRLAQSVPGKPPLKAFHLSQLLGRFGEFQKYSEPEADLLRHDFRQIIVESNLRQLAVVVSRRDWDELVVSPFREIMGTAEEACFIGFVQRAIEVVREVNIQSLKIAFIYDVGRRTQRFDELIRLIENKDYRPEVTSVSWGRVGEMAPLQAADMIAHENYRASQEWMKSGSLNGASIHFRRLVENLPGEGLILDREAIQMEVDRRGTDGRVRTL